VEQSKSCDYDVVKNDEKELPYFDTYDKILISPGPGLPENAGIVPDVIKVYSPTKSILGICLGHQAIALAFGAKLINLDQILHGQATAMHIIDKSDYLFRGFPETFNAGRYHSWVVDKNGLPEEIKRTASDQDGKVMALSHKTYDVKGVQFHPESILTPYGKKIINNFLLK